VQTAEEQHKQVGVLAEKLVEEQVGVLVEVQAEEQLALRKA
jgi:hypothetical protein